MSPFDQVHISVVVYPLVVSSVPKYSRKTFYHPSKDYLLVPYPPPLPALMVKPDLLKLKYFLEIEITQSNNDIVISQMKYMH